MTLTIELTPQEEARLTARAKAEGVSVDAFVGRVLKEVATQAADVAIKTPIRVPALPKWPGQVIGELRREDIYKDVR
jgi:hypothetical protein